MRAGEVSPGQLLKIFADARSTLTNYSSAAEFFDIFHIKTGALNATLSESLDAVEKGLRLGIQPIPFFSDAYPDSLRTINDAPPFIYVRGDVGVLNELPGVSVVGTRKATKIGLAIAERISKFLSENGWIVVSGLALGIDAAAHEGALLGRSKTVAVLAHGLEKAQPSANQMLAQRILDAGGVWVSEHEYGVKAKPAFFVHRNRIQVGLSCASVIVEGELKSGSMTQAEFCLRYKRHLFGVTPDSTRFSTMSTLPEMLVKDRGATRLVSKDDYQNMLDLIKRRAHLINI